MIVLIQIFHLAAKALWQLFPYVLLGVLASGSLRYTPVARLLKSACHRHPLVAVPVAAFIGISSPLCTYGTVPVVLQLLRSGVPIAPLATFLSASSLMNPQLLLITWGGLGPHLTVGRLIAVFVFALLLGALLHFLPLRWLVHSDLNSAQSLPLKSTPRFTVASFLKHSRKTFEFVGFYVVLGILLGATIEVLVPGRWIVAAFGESGWMQIFLAALLGVPLYACGGGTVPLLNSLLLQGMAPTAALAFLIAGPATRIAPLMALATLVRLRVVMAYVLLLIAYSVLAGIVYGWF